jgi:hypothetical protein
LVSWVDTEEMDEASSSLDPPVTAEKRLEVVVSDLFFLGRLGRTLPGSSIRSLL